MILCNISQQYKKIVAFLNLSQYALNFCLDASAIKPSSFETWNIWLNFDQSLDQLLN